MNRFLTVLALAGTGVLAGNDGGSPVGVTVYLNDAAGVPSGTLFTARGLARHMFVSAGVNLNWRTGPPKSGEASPISVDITSNTPQDFHGSALAYARPFDGVHIQVFYDRVENMAGTRLAPQLLAHVMVHEITHILEGVDWHSPEGIMKARWTPQDVARMAFQSLAFDPLDIALIHKGLAHRSDQIVSRER
jgi:hypothetical protein